MKYFILERLQCFVSAVFKLIFFTFCLKEAFLKTVRLKIFYITLDYTNMQQNLLLEINILILVNLISSLS